ncbi:MAG: hypothetical protein Q6361_01480, partial [Candidatus Hermodarchaeota archaeon]|nr:hypothetical protein [Candidatus Hermodarchaeota archaeon]
MRTIKLRAGELSIPSTAREFELFTGEKGASQAARAISNRLGKAIRFMQKILTKRNGRTVSPSDGEILNALTVADKMVSEVRYKHIVVGATDTEPRYHCSNTLLRGVSFILFGDANELR